MKPIKIISAARIAYEAVRAYYMALGDESLKPYAEASPFDRNEIIGCIHFMEEELNLTSARLHAAWMEHKISEGWVYDKDANDTAFCDIINKRSPWLVPYMELPEFVQTK